MARISANLGYLWRDRELPEAIHAAAAAGFDAVECHWPYAWPAEAVRQALAQSKLPMVCLNTARGSHGDQDFGLAAIAGRQSEFRDALEHSLEYAAAVQCPRIHALCGNAEGPKAHQTAVDNLAWACRIAAARSIEIVIEPKNQIDLPDYFLRRVDQAALLIEAVAAPNLKILFDCYHVQINQGDLLRTFQRHLPLIAHVQFASVPGRENPERGELAYERVFSGFQALGYQGYFGAEFLSRDNDRPDIEWLPRFQAIA